jgi:hypothetical protein
MDAENQTIKDPVERGKRKALLNSMVGITQKKPKKRVWKKLTPHSLDRDGPMLDKTYEDRGLYTIYNGIDMLYNHQQWGRLILANAKKDLEAHIHRAEEAGFKVVYSRTESFIVEAGALTLFESEIGDEMGRLKIDALSRNGVVVPPGNERPTFLP